MKDRQGLSRQWATVKYFYNDEPHKNEYPFFSASVYCRFGLETRIAYRLAELQDVPPWNYGRVEISYE